MDAASVATGNRLRDAHLRSAAFLALRRYPATGFQSTHLEQVGNGYFQVTGCLTLHGVRHPVTFSVSVSQRGDLWQQAGSSAHAHSAASATPNRNDFGVDQGVAMRVAADAVISVERELAVDAAQQAPEGQSAGAWVGCSALGRAI